MSCKRARILSVGTAVPETILTNKEIEQFLDTTDEWITSRSGIRQRHMFPRGQAGSAHELGASAARIALERAKLTPADIDGIICATFTPDNFFPSTACLIGNALGCTNNMAFDLSAACAGFCYGLGVANAIVVSGQCKRVLLVGAEVISKTLNWSDRTTSILFGDGAGAVVIEACEDENVGILATHMSSDSSLKDILHLPAWGENRYMSMKGQEVFKAAVRMMTDSAQKCLAQCSKTAADVDLLVPHQANVRIIQGVAEKLTIPLEKVAINVDRYGNTSSASIPLALDEAWSNGRVGPGTRVAFASLGGGLAVASAFVQF